MNTDTLSGNWQQIVGEVKQKWSKLTDDDLKSVEGNKDKLVGLIREKYGQTKEKVVDEVEKFLNEHEEDADNIKQKAGDFLGNVSEQVKACFKDSPLTCVAVAAGVGLVLGMLLLK